MAVVVVLVVILLVLHELAVDLMKKSIAVDRVKSTRIISCHRFFFCIVIHALDCFPILLLGSYSEGRFFVSEKDKQQIKNLGFEFRFENLRRTIHKSNLDFTVSRHSTPISWELQPA